MGASKKGQDHQGLSKNPKTLKDVRRNDEIMKIQSKSHKGDDYFQGHVKVAYNDPKKRTKSKDHLQSKVTASEIQKQLFVESDSDNDVSLTSARTPIGNYYNVRTPGAMSSATSDVAKGEACPSEPAPPQVNQYVV